MTMENGNPEPETRNRRPGRLGFSVSVSGFLFFVRMAPKEKIGTLF
jgi:hypothetical protein